MKTLVTLLIIIAIIKAGIKLDMKHDSISANQIPPGPPGTIFTPCARG